MVLDGPLHEARGRADGRLAEGGVAHTQHAKFGGQAIQVQADAVEVGIGGTPGQCRSHRILRGGILRNRFLGGVQQDGVDAGQFTEEPDEGGKLGSRTRPDRTGKQLMLS